MTGGLEPPTLGHGRVCAALGGTIGGVGPAARTAVEVGPIAVATGSSGAAAGGRVASNRAQQAR